jgi:uncharacterized protein (DUF1684 family)
MPFLLPITLLLLAGPAFGQSRAVVQRERAEYRAWLLQSEESPIRPAMRGRVELRWHPYDGGPAYLSRMRPDPVPEIVPLVTSEGVLVRATALGTITISIGGDVARLRVYRIPNAGEVLYEVHLRDATNGVTTHPAGRWVDLIPMGDNRFLMDLNRARNPWCAYSAEYRCPDPWPGAGFAVPVQVGELLPVFRDP